MKELYQTLANFNYDLFPCWMLLCKNDFVYCILLWTGGIWVALVMMGTASQLFDDIPLQSLGETRLYQEGNDLDTGPHAVETSEVDDKNVLGETEGEKVLFLMKIMQALRMRNDDARFYRRAIPESVDFLDIQNMPEEYEHDQMKPLMVKRVSGEPKAQIKTDVKPKSSYEAQRRWKAKKGTPMVCYFKLCSFRI